MQAVQSKWRGCGRSLARRRCRSSSSSSLAVRRAMAAARAGSAVSSARQPAALGASSASLDTWAPRASRRAAATCWCLSSSLTRSASSSSTRTSPSVAPASAQLVMGWTCSTQLDTCRQPRRSLSSSIVGPSMRCCLATRLILSAASASLSLAKAAASASTGAVSPGDEPARCACRTAVASLQAACMSSSLSSAGCLSASLKADSLPSSSATCATHGHRSHTGLQASDTWGHRPPTRGVAAWRRGVAA